jgi:hypothetical protein
VVSLLLLHLLPEAVPFHQKELALIPVDCPFAPRRLWSAARVPSRIPTHHSTLHCRPVLHAYARGVCFHPLHLRRWCRVLLLL